jgi:hypothetical protein
MKAFLLTSDLGGVYCPASRFLWLELVGVYGVPKKGILLRAGYLPQRGRFVIFGGERGEQGSTSTRIYW